jgi:hypothetical protein
VDLSTTPTLKGIQRQINTLRIELLGFTKDKNGRYLHSSAKLPNRTN